MFCRNCGKQIDDKAVICVGCGVPVKAEASATGSGAAVRMLLPIGRSGYAIAAGYLALFSVLIVPAPFALLFGILALREINQNPEKHGKGRAFFGIIAGILGTIVLLVIIFKMLFH